MKNFILLPFLLTFPLFSFSEPTTGPVKIIQIRPYNTSTWSAAFIQIDTTSVCDTSIYKIDFSLAGSKEILSVALAAMMADKSVLIEVANSGCTGWGTTIQSLYVNK